MTFVMGTDVALNGTGQQRTSSMRNWRAGKTYGDISVDHPDRNAYVNHFFNTSIFVPIAARPKGIYENSGRNIYFTLMRDLSVRKPLRIH